MDFKTFKEKYQKADVIEYPNNLSKLVPKVTVRVLVYNHVNFIKDCLDSILNQKTTFDYELLIAEDDSSDGSRELCIEYAQKFPKQIRLLLNSRENNIYIDGKPTGIFNSTFSNYSIGSKYIAICEADDYWTDEYSLQKRVDFLDQNEDFVLAFHNSLNRYEPSGEISQKLALPTLNEDLVIDKGTIAEFQFPTASILYRNNLIDVFDESLKYCFCGDYVLKAKLSQFGKSMYLHKVKPSVRRFHNDSSYGLKSTKQQYRYSTETRLFLIDYFKNKGWSPKPIYVSLASWDLELFLFELKKEKKINFKLFKRIISYSRKGEASALSVFYKRIKRKFNNL